MRFTSEGIYAAGIDLWLDPAQARPNAWLSHAHGDHARGLHSNAIATPETLRIYRLRWPEDEGIPQSLHPLRYGESTTWNGARLTAIPASHIVGAAQLLIEYQGERVVYTGDIKLRAPICGISTQIVPCDRLIIESTFGLPVYHFIDAAEARGRIEEFARECFCDGISPVFVGYPLGRGQEIVHTLCAAGLPVAVHGAIARLIPAYEAAGYAFPGWKPYSATDLKGTALVVVPTFRAQIEAKGTKFRLAYVSGWAALDNARNRSGAEELIPYSDHADFEELLAIVDGSGAREVDVVHGYTEVFAQILNSRGTGVTARAPLATASRDAEEQQAL